ncbi:MAG: CoA-binding protein [Gammaproteobacteria bacterium]|nr:CoA-binding protein [Gammaproteobacteria bacterium]
MPELRRFISPKAVVTVGGGWAANVITQLQKSGYTGDIWPVHPHRDEINGIACFADVAALPGVPDAAFVGVNREQTVEVVGQLSELGCGGAVCFASGFKESDQADLQNQLIANAGDMPILGPNCYGFINYVDNVCIWPDQHGGQPVESGVAIIAQSSNISISMTMQQRGLPLAYLFTLGNQAQIGVSEMTAAMLDNPRVNAVGLYLEGVDDIAGFEAMSSKARALGKSIVVLKVGKSAKARAATLTHTASLAGGAAASSALLRRLGLVEVASITELLETLKLLNFIGPLRGPDVVSVSCSGGEASLMSDLAQSSGLNFRDFTGPQCEALTKVLGPKVEIANPLDYHTYIWGDVPVMTGCFEAVMRSEFDLTVFVLDLPRADRCDSSGHECAIESIIAARRATGAAVAVLSLMPENLDEAICQRFISAGVVPLHGMQDGIAAIDAAIRAGQLARAVPPKPSLVAAARRTGEAITLTEYAAKQALAEHGVCIPPAGVAQNREGVPEVAHELGFPLALKALGVAHKTDLGAVALDIHSYTELALSLEAMPESPQGYLVEAMVADSVVELIVGVTIDETGLVLLTIGAGGVMTEIIKDTAHLLLPARRDEIAAAVNALQISPLLSGYRGKPAVNQAALLDAVVAVGNYVEQNLDQLIELDINPLMVGQSQSIAADALIRLQPAGGDQP